MGKRPQRRKLNDDLNDEGGDVVYLNGRLAWKMITAFEVWIKIVEFIWSLFSGAWWGFV